jgi:hypothetical protein
VITFRALKPEVCLNNSVPTVTPFQISAIQLLLWELTALYCVKHVNALCGQNVELLV